MSDADKIQPLVERLVAHEASPFTKAHIEQLSSFDEATLETMIARCGDTAEIDEPVKETAKVDKPAKVEKLEEPTAEPLTAEEWMNQAPAHVRDMVAKYERKEKEQRTALISKLSKAQTTFAADELESKDTDELEKLSAFIDEAANYEGRHLEVGESEVIDTVPDPWNLAKAS